MCLSTPFEFVSGAILQDRTGNDLRRSIFREGHIPIASWSASIHFSLIIYINNTKLLLLDQLKIASYGSFFMPPWSQNSSYAPAGLQPKSHVC